MEAVAVLLVLVVVVARSVRQRRDRKARSTVARALRGPLTSSEARFARYPKGRWGR